MFRLSYTSIHDLLISYLHCNPKVIVVTFTFFLSSHRAVPDSNTNSHGSTWHFDVSEPIRSSAPKIAALLLSQGSNTPNSDNHGNSSNTASSSNIANISSDDSRIVVNIDTEATLPVTTTSESTDPASDNRPTAAATVTIFPSCLHQLRERSLTAIDTLRSRWSTGQGLGGGGENAATASVPRPSSSSSGNSGGTFLDDLSSTLLFSEEAVLRACILLALCGWMPVTTSTTGAASTTTTSMGGHGSNGQGSSTASCSSSGGDRGSDNVAVSFRCNVCGRTFPMTCFLASSSSSSSSSTTTAIAPSHIDPLSQHRAFCLWARSESINSSPSHHEGIPLVPDLGSSIPSMPGWLHCALAMTDIDPTPPSSSSSTAFTVTSSSSFMEQRQLSQHRQSSSLTSTTLEMHHHIHTNVPTSTSNHSSTYHPISQEHTSGIHSNNNIDAEQAYKKIKLVLDMATTTTTTKPLPNRTTQPH